MLEIKKLNVSVEDKHILKDLNLNIGKGEIHAIMGPNGSGKNYKDINMAVHGRQKKIDYK